MGLGAKARSRAAIAVGWGGLALGLVSSCREPSQITLIPRTNVPYRANVTVAMWSSTSGTFPAGSEPQVQTSEPWLGDGNIGDLVLTPRGASNEGLSVRVVMGVGRDPKTCTDADAKGCIVAKRRLAFVPHTRLRVPLVLHLACDGVVCDGDSTCNYVGRCVPATIDPGTCTSASGCELAGDETVVAVAPLTPPPVDAGVDTAPAPVCTPGTKEDCYSGPAGTLGVGNCRGGIRQCGADGQWSVCAGEVLPRAESCAVPGDDDDCDGIPSCQIYAHDTQSKKILRMALGDPTRRQEWGPFSSLSDMALDRPAMTMYFTQSNPNVQVSRFALNAAGAAPEKLFDGLQDPLQGIALDLVGRRLYYGEYYRGLYVASMNGGAPAPLVLSAALAPANGVGLGVERDSVAGAIYFFTRQNGAGNFAGRKIWRVDDNGDNLKELRQLQNSSCLAIDVPRGFMYFVDSVTEPAPQTLYRANLNGSGVVVLNAAAISCRSMAVRPSDGTLFFVDDTTGRGVLRRATFTGDIASFAEVYPTDPALDLSAIVLDLPD